MIQTINKSKSKIGYILDSLKLNDYTLMEKKALNAITKRSYDIKRIDNRCYVTPIIKSRMKQLLRR